MSKLSVIYSPELIDEAIREHIQKRMGVTSSIQVEYTHRRKTKKVSAEVTFSPTLNQSPISDSVMKELTTPAGDLLAQEQKEAVSYVLDDELPTI